MGAVQAWGVHDLTTLRGLLSELEQQFERFPALAIDWISAEALEPHFGFPVAAACHGVGRTKTIVVLDEFKTAPLYVLRYLVLHEALHVLHPPVGHNLHPYAFRIAEQSSPLYLPACRWLHKRGNRLGLKRKPVQRKSAYWKKVLSPLYGGDSAAGYAFYLRACSGAWLDAHASAVATAGRARSRA